MKLLHTADWHIGKQLNGFDLLEEQWHAFHEMRRIANEEKVEGIIIAGDLYDRAIPSVAAVKAFDEMLRLLNIEDGFPIYAISGNHDGANRLNFGNNWFAENKLFLRTQLSEAITPIDTPEIQFFLLPFFDPIDARIYFGIEEPTDLRAIDEAVAKVIEEMKDHFDPKKKQVLVTHFNVSGEQNETYELTSETTSTVGGLNVVSGKHFADFDYVALGHLHLWQASPSETIRYSGSPIKFNTKEAKNKKGVYIVDITEEVKTTFHVIPPQKDLIVLKGTYAELIDPDFYNQYPVKGTAFYSIKLTDRPTVKNIRQSLSDIYGDIVELHFAQSVIVGQWAEEELIQRTTASDEVIVSDFYKEVTNGKELTTNQQALIEEVFLSLRKEGEEV